MSDEDEDFGPAEELTEEDIQAWAANLTPDGSPGAMTAQLRAAWGDANYEKYVANQDRAQANSFQRFEIITSMWTVAVIYAVLFGFVGFVAAVTAVLHFIF